LGIGEDVDFHGTLTVVGVGRSRGRHKNWIEKALLLTPAIGAHKSAGFGQITNPKVSALPAIVLHRSHVGKRYCS